MANKTPTIQFTLVGTLVHIKIDTVEVVLSITIPRKVLFNGLSTFMEKHNAEDDNTK